jgi:hypothetical protein
MMSSEHLIRKAQTDNFQKLFSDSLGIMRLPDKKEDVNVQ